MLTAFPLTLGNPAVPALARVPVATHPPRRAGRSLEVDARIVAPGTESAR